MEMLCTQKVRGQTLITIMPLCRCRSSPRAGVSERGRPNALLPVSLLLPENQRGGRGLPSVLQLPPHQLPGQCRSSFNRRKYRKEDVVHPVPTLLPFFPLHVQMESRPEQMQALMPGVANNKFPLQTLAQEVEEEEGGGRPEVFLFLHSLRRLSWSFLLPIWHRYSKLEYQMISMIIWCWHAMADAHF